MKFLNLSNLFKKKKKKKTVTWAGKVYECDDYHFNSDGTLTLYCGFFIRILEKEPAIYHTIHMID